MSDLYDFGVKIGEFLRGVLQPGDKAPERPPPTPQRKFPASGVDYIQHEIRVRLSFEKGDEEIVTLYGAMLIQRDEARIGKHGRREVPFKVLSWSACGWSRTLGASVTYALSPDTDQPVSVIRAEQEEADFPASFLFNVVFDARVDNMTVYRSLHGRPEGENFLRVPPTGDRMLSPTITRFTDLGRVTVKHPQLGEIVASPLDCNDKEGRTVVTIPGLQRIKGEPEGY